MQANSAVLSCVSPPPGHAALHTPAGAGVAIRKVYQKTRAPYGSVSAALLSGAGPCLLGLWPNLRPGCRMYTHEARNLEFISVYFDQAWWRQNLGEDAPGFVGSGVGLPLGLASNWGSELGYAQKPDEASGIAPDEDPQILERALLDSEKAAFAQLRADRLASGG